MIIKTDNENVWFVYPEDESKDMKQYRGYYSSFEDAYIVPESIIPEIINHLKPCTIMPAILNGKIATS